MILRIGTPITVKNMCFTLSMIFVNAQINSLGVVAVAVTGICSKLQSLMQVVSQAMMDGTSAMVGQNVGAGKHSQVRRVVWDACLVGLVFAAVLGAVFLLFPYGIFSIFSNDETVIALARPFMAVCAINVFAGALMSPTMGLINGVGDTGYNMIVAIADGVVARIALSLLFGYGLSMGALGFFLGNCLAGFVSVLGGGVYFLRGWWKRKGSLVDGATQEKPRG